MKILFLDTKPIRRGAQVFVDDLKAQLTARGHEVFRIFLYEEENYQQLDLKDTDEVLPFKDNSLLEKIPSVQPGIISALMKRINLLEPDIILCNGSRTLKYAAVVKRMLRGSGVKWVYRVIDSAAFWNKGMFTLIYYRRWVIPAMDAAVGASKRSLEEMKQHYRFNKRGECIPRAVDAAYMNSLVAGPQLREDLGFRSNTFLVLFLGNLTRQKRPDRFVEIIDRLKKSIGYVHGVVVGDGPLRPVIEQMVKDRGLTGSITLAGYQKDVRPWIAIADVLVLCSDTEGMPGVVLESAARGVPAVSAEVGGVAEFIDDGINGYLVDPEDLDGYVSKTRSLFEDPGSRERMGKAASQKILEGYEISKIADAYDRYFSELCGKTGKEIKGKLF